MNAKNHISYDDVVSKIIGQVSLDLYVGGRGSELLLREELRQRIYGAVREEARRVMEEVMANNREGLSTSPDVFRRLLEAGDDMVFKK